ncbi:hypothetical protein BLA29_015510 [Euroglyphus maynei]|uniref:Uncharacterized protein n=1 Tax=Euroglyphus maynei TaxID=6958 RepID=A0A1Y3BFN1_EURMA|nr:hypothetical protein BLA29_015510 [Euroglyphus maynei]
MTFNIIDTTFLITKTFGRIITTKSTPSREMERGKSIESIPLSIILYVRIGSEPQNGGLLK